MNTKEQLKHYIRLEEEKIKKSTDFMLLEKLNNNLGNLNNSLHDILSKEYCLKEIDVNN